MECCSDSSMSFRRLFPSDRTMQRDTLSTFSMCSRTGPFRRPLPDGNSPSLRSITSFPQCSMFPFVFLERTGNPSLVCYKSNLSFSPRRHFLLAYGRERCSFRNRRIGSHSSSFPSFLQSSLPLFSQHPVRSEEHTSELQSHVNLAC